MRDPHKRCVRKVRGQPVQGAAAIEFRPVLGARPQAAKCPWWAGLSDTAVIEYKHRQTEARKSTQEVPIPLRGNPASAGKQTDRPRGCKASHKGPHQRIPIARSELYSRL